MGWVTLFNPPPHFVRQIVHSFMCYWVDAPCTTLAVFFLPGVFQHAWGKYSTYIIHVSTFHLHDLPFISLLSFNIPLTLLYLPFFVPSTTTSLYPPTGYKINSLHQHQAKYVQGLLATDFEKIFTMPMQCFP